MEKSSVLEKMCSVSERKMINNLCSECNFDPFDGIKNYDAEFAVKSVQIEYLLKLYVWQKRMVRIGIVLERISVCA